MKVNWKIIVGVIMILLSLAFYFLHYALFRDAHHIILYLVGDVAFVFIEVLLVTLVIHRFLNDWEKKTHLKKLNMIIEVFFSEYGKHLLKFFAGYDRNAAIFRQAVSDETGDCEIDFHRAFRVLKNYAMDLEIGRIDLAVLAGFLSSKRGFIVNLLQNANLLEHQSFTEMLMAIFHVTEELVARDLRALSPEDKAHTKVDLERAYGRLTAEWLSYMKYTRENYPYFFLFALKTNPFDEKSPWLGKLPTAPGDGRRVNAVSGNDL